MDSGYELDGPAIEAVKDAVGDGPESEEREDEDEESKRKSENKGFGRDGGLVLWRVNCEEGLGVVW